MKARLTVVAGEARPASLELEPTQAASLGRSRDNTVVLHCEHASRLHAKVLFEDGRWQVQDFGLNGTIVNGERIQQRADLESGQEIRIGQVRIRFTLDEVETNSHGSRLTGSERRDHTPSSGLITTSRVHSADMGVLCSFMAAHAGGGEPHTLLREALSLWLTQSAASATGYLSPDPADPLPKVVQPENAGFDNVFSRHMTRKAQRDGKTIWLATELGESRPTDSLKEVTDALCVPVKSAGLALGMLHAIRKDGFFVERDVRFGEALADFLAGCLRAGQARRNLEVEVARLRGHPPVIEDLIGDSAAMVQLRDQVVQIGPQPVPVLLRGEAGVGVEVVALALHRRSSRSNGPFLTVPISSIPPALLDAELFGPRPGGEPGCCVQADEGTLFLDEITDLTPEAQTRLLRLLDDKCVRSTGSTPELRLDVRADVRLIAATQVDLEDAVARNRLRKSLFERLSRAAIEVPPLRSHLEDVPYLVQYFLDKLATECRREVTVTESAMRKLQAYFWPGNHRQLRAELEAAVFRAGRDVIDESDVLIGCDKLLMARA